MRARLRARMHQVDITARRCLSDLARMRMRSMCRHSRTSCARERTMPRKPLRGRMSHHLASTPPGWQDSSSRELPEAFWNTRWKQPACVDFPGIQTSACVDFPGNFPGCIREAHSPRLRPSPQPPISCTDSRLGKTRCYMNKI